MSHQNITTILSGGELAQLAQSGWRMPILIQGTEQWRFSIAEQLIQIAQFTHGLQFNSASQKNIKHYQQWLGQEFDYIWIDSLIGLNPDVVAALAGTIKAGGLLIISLSDSILRDDPDINRFLPWQSEAEKQLEIHSYFNQRLLNLSQSNPFAVIYSQHQNRPADTIDLPKQTDWQAPTELTAEQRQIIHSISQAKSGHFVITADRGRGKSAVLGALAATINQNSNTAILITAPARNCIQTAQVWYQKTMQSEERLIFSAPDSLLLTGSDCDLLIIDEAAALPAQILKQLAKRYPFIIYATTEHGYEGSGKGFSQKFITQLKKDKQAVTHFRLNTPIRWAKQDPLEHWLNQVYLLDAEPDEIKQNQTTQTLWLSRQQLVKKPEYLASLFGLLVQAHYRTTPSDLRYILDSPSMHVCVTQNESGQIVAAGIISVEGALPDDLATACMNGKRRPNGHLTPQMIAAQTGQTDFARLTGWRIVRIAVSPNWQQYTYGSQLLQWLYTEAKCSTADYLSTSFSTSAQLLRFWQKNDFELVRSGMTSETNTGLFSSLMIRPLTQSCQILVSALAEQNQQQISYLLTSRYRYLPTEIIWQWLLVKQTENHAQPLNSMIEGFALQHSNYFSAQPLLAQFCRQHASLILKTLDKKERSLLCRALLSQWDIQDLCKTFHLNGKKMAIKQLRNLIARLLNTDPKES